MDIHTRLVNAESNLVSNEALQAAVLEANNLAAAAATGTLGMMIDRQDRLRDRVDVRVSRMQAIVTDSTAITDAGLSSLRSSSESAIEAMESTYAEQLAEVSTQVDAQLNNVNVTLQSTLERSLLAIAPSSVYYQYGRKTCTAPAGHRATKLWHGYLWGSGHNYQGGGNQNLCLQDSGGAHGGTIRNGWDPRDRMIPLRAESGHYACENCVLRRREGYTVPCAKCVTEAQCYVDQGEANCPTGWSSMYKGYLFGGYRHHHGNNERTCIDSSGPTGDWDNNQNWGGHIYPTMEEANLRARTNKKSVACNYCCKNM